MKRFPGRFLEEIDKMNWGRFLRAVKAEHIETLEQKRQLYLGDVSKFSESEWEQIAEHDELVANYG